MSHHRLPSPSDVARMLRADESPTLSDQGNVCWDPPACIIAAADPAGALSQWYVGCVVSTIVTVLHAFRLLGALWEADDTDNNDGDSDPRRRRRRVAREVIVFLVAMAGVAVFAAELRACRGESGVVWLLVALAAANVLVPALLADEDDTLMM